MIIEIKRGSTWNKIKRYDFQDSYTLFKFDIIFLHNLYLFCTIEFWYFIQVEDNLTERKENQYITFTYPPVTYFNKRKSSWSSMLIMIFLKLV